MHPNRMPGRHFCLKTVYYTPESAKTYDFQIRHARDIPAGTFLRFKRLLLLVSLRGIVIELVNMLVSGHL